MIAIDQTKAAEVAKRKIRLWRETEFAKNDVALQNAMADGDEVAKHKAIERREYLRALPDQCNNKNVAELQQILSELGIV